MKSRRKPRPSEPDGALATASVVGLRGRDQIRVFQWPGCSGDPDEPFEHSGLIRFVRTDAGSTVIDVWPGSGDSTPLVVLPESSRPPDVVRLHLFSPYRPSPDQGSNIGRFQSSRSIRGSSLAGFTSFVDHVAAARTGTSHAESLHRIEPAAVREPIRIEKQPILCVVVGSVHDWGQCFRTAA